MSQWNSIIYTFKNLISIDTHLPVADEVVTSRHTAQQNEVHH